MTDHATPKYRRANTSFANQSQSGLPFVACCDEAVVHL